MTAQWLLIRDGMLIDGVSDEPHTRASVLVQDDRIAAVGPDVDASLVPRGEPLTVVDATGRTIMPGMIDAHCHLTYGESRSQEEQDLYTSVELRTLHAAFNAKKMLRAGVTGISQPGGSYYIGVGIREGIREGIVEGPRMTAAGRYITTSNGLTDWYPESVGVPDGSIGFLTNTLPEMLTAVRKQVKNGVDLIKLSDSPFGDYQAFTNDELKGIADLAHQLGKRVTIHARGSAETRAAIEAGFDWIMHGNVMTDETVERLAESRIPLVPTLLLLANWVDYGELVGVPAGLRAGAQRMLEKTADTLHRAHEAGVRFLMGTDTGFGIVPYGEWHARELELLMDYAGLTAMEAIQTATGNAGVVLNLDGEIGVLRSGAIADVLVVNGDPLRDIRVLQDKTRIEIVVHDGKVVSFDEQIDRRWPVEPALYYSNTDLTWDMVNRGAPAPVTGPPPLPRDDAHDLLHDLHEREFGARIPAE